jgi:hypothetical protein
MKCYDEDIIQAFLDGEVAPALAENIACHISTCETCLMLVEAVEQENSFVFETLNNEFNVAVPTEKIWESINAEIKETKISWWQRLFSFSILPQPSLMFAGAFLIFATIFGLYLNFKKDEIQPIQTIAKKDDVKTVQPTQIEPEVNPSTVSPEVKPTLPKVENASAQTKPRRVIEQPNFVVEKAVYRPQTEEKNIGKDSKPIKKGQPTLRVEQPQFIDGEETYVKTITTLAKNVEGDKLNNIRPSSRINYEKNMAIVDDAITKMRKQIRKNPKDETAKEILFASYQNKIDLLNSMNEKSELIATR